MFDERALERDLLPTGIFHAIKIPPFSAAAYLACSTIGLNGCPCPHSSLSNFFIPAQTFSPASKRLPEKAEIFRLNPSWSLRPFPNLSLQRFSRLKALVFDPLDLLELFEIYDKLMLI